MTKKSVLITWLIFSFFLFETFFSNAIAEDEENAGIWSGYVSVQGRGFWQDAQFPDQRDGDISLAFEPEYYKDWNNGFQAVTFSPFLRLDSTDPERTHF